MNSKVVNGIRAGSYEVSAAAESAAARRPWSNASRRTCAAGSTRMNLSPSAVRTRYQNRPASPTQVTGLTGIPVISRVALPGRNCSARA